MEDRGGEGAVTGSSTETGGAENHPVSRRNAEELETILRGFSANVRALPPETAGSDGAEAAELLALELPGQGSQMATDLFLPSPVWKA